MTREPQAPVKSQEFRAMDNPLFFQTFTGTASPSTKDSLALRADFAQPVLVSPSNQGVGRAEYRPAIAPGAD
jgi:hypothetical protein